MSQYIDFMHFHLDKVLILCHSTYVHASIPAMPLGGVGYSGLGSYRGRASFDCFTHRRSMATVPASGSSPLRVIYPPYNSK